MAVKNLLKNQEMPLNWVVEQVHRGATLALEYDHGSGRYIGLIYNMWGPVGRFDLKTPTDGGVNGIYLLQCREDADIYVETDGNAELLGLPPMSLLTPDGLNSIWLGALVLDDASYLRLRIDE